MINRYGVLGAVPLLWSLPLMAAAQTSAPATIWHGGTIVTMDGNTPHTAQAVIERFHVKAGGPQAVAKSLSGGNLQKFIVGREIEAAPKLLIVSQPTWGVDVGASAQIRAALLALRDAGCAVLVVSEELEELLELSDVLYVIANGKLSPPLKREEAEVSRIGAWMSGLWHQDAQEVNHVAS